MPKGKTATIRVRVTDATKAKALRAAKRAGLGLSAWVRRLLEGTVDGKGGRKP